MRWLYVVAEEAFLRSLDFLAVSGGRGTAGCQVRDKGSRCGDSGFEVHR
jgi:hypothetical protein